MKETVTTWWLQLAPRERKLIIWSSSLLLAALGYAYLWQPITTERLKLRNSLLQLRVNAADMASQGAEASRLRQRAHSKLSGPDLQAAIHQIASEIEIADKNLQATLLDEHRINIIIHGAAFDNWLALASRMQSQNHVRVESCRIESMAEGGMVQIQAVMSSN